MNEKLPYYMAYPMPLAYDDEKIERRDYEYMKSLYPSMAKKLLPYVEDECDRMEYQCSMMYDEYPDRLQLRMMGNRIYDNVRKHEKSFYGDGYEDIFSETEVEDQAISFPGRPPRPDRPPYDDNPSRPGRPPYDDNPSRPGRPPYDDNPSRPGRPPYDDNPSRPGWPPYDDNPSRPGRPPYDGNPSRPGRPPYDGNPSRPGRPPYDDNPSRPGRPPYDDRPSRPGRPPHGRGNQNWLHDLIDVMLYQELYKRRCDNRRCSRKFY